MSKYQWEVKEHEETGELYIEKMIENSLPEHYFFDSTMGVRFLCNYINKLEAQVSALKNFNERFEP